MDDRVDPRLEIGLALFLIAVCGIILYETRGIPAGTFEPLGSAPVPQATAGLIILLALLVIGRAWRASRKGMRPEPAPGDVRPVDAAVIMGLSVLYVLAMQLRLVNFAVMTILFLLLAIGFLIRFQRRGLLWAFLVAVVTGFGCQYVFTRIFVVDLPGL